MVGQEDSHSLQPDKQALVPQQIRVRIPLAQLIHTIRTPREDKHRRQRQEAKEEAHPAVDDVGAAAPRPQVADHVVGKTGAKDHQHKDLQAQTGEGEVDARLGGAAADGREGAAGGLEDEAEEVAGDEDPVEELWPEAGELGGEELDSGGVSVYVGRVA